METMTFLRRLPADAFVQGVCRHSVKLLNLMPHAMQELLEKCHPLGMFDSISTLAVASNMRELYRLVLVDTPLAPYFSESLTAGVCLPVACCSPHPAEWT